MILRGLEFVRPTHTQVTGSNRKCDLRLTEKLAIMRADPVSLLNTCDEFVCKCRQMNKLILRFLKKK